MHQTAIRLAEGALEANQTVAEATAATSTPPASPWAAS